MENKTLIKILSSVSETKLKEIKQKISQLEGVEGVKINEDVISYDLNEWASDYDVMVKILEVLSELGVEGEPLFEDEVVVTPHSHEECCDHGEEGCHCHDHEHDHDGDCHCHDHEHGEGGCHCHDHGEEGGFSCQCENHENKSEQELKKERKVKFFELCASALVFIIGLILSSIESTSEFSQYVLLVAFVIAGYDTVFAGITGVFKGKIFSENMLMLIASLSAIMLGELPEAVGIMLLSNVGNLFESSAIANVNSVVNRLKELTPETATILVDGVEKTVKLAEVKVGDTVVIKPGERVGVDGKIVWGSSSFNTSAITGESVYKDLTVGSKVFAGYLNVNGAVKVEVETSLEEGTLSKIEHAVKHSLEKKAKSEKFVEKFAKIYTPCVVILAILIAFIPPFFANNYSDGLATWGVRAVMLLCVSCPCSLVVSVPLTYYCGIGACAKNGALVKSSEALDKLSKTTAIAFDKTGTLTTGKLQVVSVLSSKDCDGKVLEILAGIEKYSNHPLAQAICEYASENSVEIKNFTEIAGKGVTGEYNGKKVIAGSSRFLEENGVTPIEVNEVGIKLYLAVDGVCQGAVVLIDEPRKTAYGCMRELYDAGVKNTVMLTGDNKEYAKLIRKQLKMSRSYSELLPTDKVEKLELLIEEHKGKTVVAVGDGINDAPLLSRAEVSIALGEEASAITVESADIVLSSGNLSKVPYLVKLARRTKSIVLQNVLGSILIKVAVMVLGIVGVTSSLWLAIGADVGLLILSILNAIRNRSRII